MNFLGGISMLIGLGFGLFIVIVTILEFIATRKFIARNRQLVDSRPPKLTPNKRQHWLHLGRGQKVRFTGRRGRLLSARVVWCDGVRACLRRPRHDHLTIKSIRNLQVVGPNN